ncbi:hypothetical protein XELAEV_18032115mg [Xenopus laevis]|uniref:Uncharacterized protein n=1 Tax=Xenopus laevis TaxID=8355 RepID=A0A974CQH8_XENLA|nr:hypothetical protein XELAEV_18032115mg [Xenopus laevis]
MVCHCLGQLGIFSCHCEEHSSLSVQMTWSAAGNYENSHSGGKQIFKFQSNSSSIWLKNSASRQALVTHIHQACLSCGPPAGTELQAS